MRNETVRAVLDELAGRHICDDCADTFLDILDRVTAQADGQQVRRLMPSPRRETIPISPSMLATLRASVAPAHHPG